MLCYAAATTKHFSIWSAKLGYRANSSATFANIFDDADNKLFPQITGNSQHLLHPLLPPEREQHYSCLLYTSDAADE